MASPNSVSFKAYLREKGSQKEVRRFGMEQNEVVSFALLKAKLQQIFPSLAGSSFNVSWKDVDGDNITISSDQELLTALTETTDMVRRLYIDVSDSPSVTFPTIEIKPAFIDVENIDIPLGFGDADLAESEEAAEDQGEPGHQSTGCPFQPQEHYRVICDGCNSKITSHRYKCVECPDFDLCSSCESRGHHSEHIMARIPLSNCYATRSPYFLKGLSSLRDAVSKIQHRRKKMDRRHSRMPVLPHEYLYNVASNYFIDWEKCMRDSKCDKPEKKCKRDRRQCSSTPKESGPTPQAPQCDKTSDAQPTTSNHSSEGTCPAASGLVSSWLNKENIGMLQRILEQLCPVPDQLLQEVAKGLAGTTLNDEPASSSSKESTSTPMETSSPPGPSNTTEVSPSIVPSAANATTEPVAPTITQTSHVSESSSSSNIQSPRPGSAEPDTEGWMVVDPQAGDGQNTQSSIYPQLPAATPSNDAQVQSQPANIPQPQMIPTVQHRDQAVKICLERLGRMGYNVDDQFIVEVAEANRGDLSRVLDMLG